MRILPIKPHFFQLQLFSLKLVEKENIIVVK